MKKILFPLAILLAFSMFSCSSSGDDDDETPAKSPEEQAVDDMLTDEQVKILTDLGMPINEGANPPTITGYYNTNDLDCIGDTQGQESYLQNLNYYWNFYDQSGNNVKLDYFNDGNDVGTAKGAFIFGEGNDFTVYMETQGQNTNYDITYTTVNLYSGTFTATGITDFTLGFIMTGKTGDDDDKRLMPVNAARVYEEGDGLAEEIDNPGFDILAKNRAIGEDIKRSIMAMIR